MNLRSKLPSVALLTWAALVPLMAAAQAGGGAQALLAQHRQLAPQLEHNVFGRPLALQSKEASDQLAGDIYAVIDHRFDEVSSALKQPGTWCEILMLHLNTKHCAVEEGGTARTVAVAVGRKFDQPLSDAQRIAFACRVNAAGADYLDMRLDAAQGPMSTRNYRIVLEAAPLDGGHTFIHLGYAYAYGPAARLAMKGYLATLGSDKVGFTTTGKTTDGRADFIGGVRGVVERNTMRYYLPIDAYLDLPGTSQREKRLTQWFDGTESHARQLHEVERDDYLRMKRSEFKRLQDGSTP